MTTSAAALEPHRDAILTVLTVAVPPAAIAAGTWKALDTRQLAASLVMYFSFFLYFPSVLHAYWVLNVKENGGWEKWGADRKEQAEHLWNEKGGRAKEAVDSYWPQIVSRKEQAQQRIHDVIDNVKHAYEQIKELVAKARALVQKTIKEAREAYDEGTIVNWIKEQAHQLYDLARSYPRMEAVIVYVQKRFADLLKLLDTVISELKKKAAEWFPLSAHSVSDKKAENGHANGTATPLAPKDDEDTPTPVKTPKKKGGASKNNTPTSATSNDQFETAEESFLSEEGDYSQEL